MENEIKEVFEQIHADRALKEETKRYVYHNTCGYRARNLHIYRKFAILAACIVVFFCGTGGFMYITPVSVISIDVNPSIDLTGLFMLKDIIRTESSWQNRFKFKIWYIQMELISY